MKEKVFKGIAIGFGLSAAIIGVIAVVIIIVSNGKGEGRLGERLENAGNSEKTVELTEEEIKKAGEQEFHDKVDKILQVIDAYYYKDYDREKMYDMMLHSMVESLGDKYSFYFSPGEFETKQNKIDGSFGGVGISMGVDEKGGFYVVSYAKGSPADGKLELGDRIIAIDGKDVEGLSLDEVVELGRGKEGTTVVYTVMRNGQRVDAEMVREIIVMNYVSSKMIDASVGYIYVSSFTKEGAEQFANALDELKRNGMKSLIIDLRDNGGGNFAGCQKMLEKLLPQGTELVYTLDKYGNKEYTYDTTVEKLDLPMVILCNGHTASSSEIFIGALKSNNAATVIGTKTFGKGLIQVIKSLDDGSGVELTGWTYFTPDGEEIHGVGITPDIIVEDEDIENIDVCLEVALNELNR